jgi:hemerythrin-like metal-binding protein
METHTEAARQLMPESGWSANLALGVPLFDEAHEALAEQIAELQARPDTEFEEGMVALIEALEADFRVEEELMEAIEYAALKSHREQHARVLATLHGLREGETATSRHAVALILPWFHAHLATADTALAIALQLAATEGKVNLGSV